MSDSRNADPSSIPRELQALRLSLVDRIWAMMAIFAIVAAPASASRAGVTGWLPTYTIQLVVAVFIIGVYVFRRKIPIQVKAGLCVGVFFLGSLPGLLSFGILGSSIQLAVTGCLFAGLFYARTTFLLSVALALALLGGAGFAFVAGWVAIPVDANQWIRHPGAWISVCVASMFLPLMVFNANQIYQRSIQALLVELQRQKDIVAHQATHDSLTGLPTLRLSRDRLDQAVARARRTDSIVALLMIDLDRFKNINDEFGHDAGDQVLRVVAERIQHSIRNSDTAARIGGDEFLVILPSAGTRSDIGEVAERIAVAVRQPIDHETGTLSISCSIGIALWPDDDSDVEKVRGRADAAMYRAKRSSEVSWLFADSPPATASPATEPPAREPLDSAPIPSP
jgi:diguanylate cyclase (GGDEF)-like protein